MPGVGVTAAPLIFLSFHSDELALLEAISSPTKRCFDDRCFTTRDSSLLGLLRGFLARVIVRMKTQQKDTRMFLDKWHKHSIFGIVSVLAVAE